MATEVGSIYYKLDLDSKDFDSNLDKSGGQMKSFGDRLDDAKVGSFALLGGLTVAVAGATAFGVASVGAFTESQNLIAQTEAVLKSTGGVAGVTADQVGKLATQFENLTPFSDETVRSGENLLLTFTNIGKDIFPQATETMLNMSQALGQDVKGSATQLGKALQDPILGVTALRRVGVNFNQQQQDQIKTLVESGKSLDAQKLILKELTTEFGGSAKAAGETFAGSMAKAKNGFNNLMELVGQKIVNTLQPLVKGFNDWFKSMGGPEGVLKSLTTLAAQIAPYLPIIAGAVIGGLVPAFVALGAAIAGALLHLLPFVAAGAVLGFLAMQLINHFGGIQGTLQALQPIFDAMKQGWDLLMIAWRDVLLPAVMSLWTNISENLLPALQKLWQTVSPLLLPALKILGVVLGGVVVADLWVVINALNIMVSVITGLIGFFDDLLKTMKNVFGWVINNVGKAVDAIGKLNPFAKHSPSLVEMVDKGTDTIAKMYGNMFKDITGFSGSFTPQLASALPAASPGSVQNLNTNRGVTVNVDMSGIAASSRSEFRKLGKDLIESVNEELRAKGVAEIGGA